MKTTQESVREAVSALADGRLEGDDFAQTVDRLCADDELQATWRTYHVVGDVLRAGRQPACTDGNQFLARFQARLAAEPVQSLPKAMPVVQPQSVPMVRAPAANEPVFRWKLVAGVASLTAAAAIGWAWVGNGVAVPTSGPQLASQDAAPAQPSAEGSVLAAMQQSAPTVNPGGARVLVGSGANAPQVMLRDPRLDQLLEAHRQAAGGAQMPSGFLRNATFESPSR
ncbi:sigma-E factor negative regulatory protein [Variovorax sp. LT1P1]|uniref:sigma-E factor negative regulatory protein n=1 Tax=Variovorax sp. LT1P1 TaxID=3443730 RepID=UPI003F453E6A